MKSILTAVLAISVLAAVELLCLRYYGKTREASLGMTRVEAIVSWNDKVPVPPAVIWVLFAAAVILLTRAKHKN